MNFNNSVFGASVFSYSICTQWSPFQRSALFQLGNVCFLVAFLAPHGNYGLLFLRSSLIAGYVLYSAWAWSVICAPTLFAWAMILVLLNFGQMLYIFYRLRPAKFSPYLENIYQTLFAQIEVDRDIFTKLISNHFAHFISLENGEAYAVENMTRTDRLALLIHGKINVLKGNRILHSIQECEFLDSPEFNATKREKKRFEISLVAASECQLIVWHREDIEFMMLKHHYIKNIIQGLIAADICQKLQTLHSQTVGISELPNDMRITLFESKVQSRSPSLETCSIPPSIIDKNRLMVPSILPRKLSPICLPLDGNIELAGWYQSVLKRDVIGRQSIK